MDLHRTLLPTIQLKLRPGILELGWGHPPLDQLPVVALQQAATMALQRYGGAALTYGYMAGPGPLIHYLCARIEEREGRAVAPAEIVVTGGASQALDLILTLCTQPGDTVLIEAPTYHLAVRILRAHPVKLVAIPLDEDGLQVDALAETLMDLRRRGERPRLLYTIPTFHNPTGRSLSLPRRQTLVALAAQTGLLIVEDDVYRELAYDGPAPPSLWSLAPEQVLRMGSFSKSLAPGLRLGWLTGPPALVSGIAHSGLLDSGGGINHFTALAVSEVCAGGGYDQQVERLRNLYRTQRDALLAALAAMPPPGCAWGIPGGGFFVWVRLPTEIDAQRLLPLAEQAGVAYLPGATFHIDGGGRDHLRLAFSLYAPAELATSVERLGSALRSHNQQQDGS